MLPTGAGPENLKERIDHVCRHRLEGQLYRDLAPDMKPRDRRLRVMSVGNARAALVVEHDLCAVAGKKTHASITRLMSTAFELLEDPADTDPQYLVLLAAMAEVHRPEATPADYARAALHAIRGVEQ